jgi:aspartate/methionine/tyrosine aminotransferase
MSGPPFSARTAWSRAPGALGALLAETRRAGRTLVDLTDVNPTRCGLSDASLGALLADPRAGRYQPEPLGASEARRAVAGYYERRRLAVGAEQVVLCASSSEAYGWLIKLLCDPGDVVLVPEPAYPLLPMLAELEAVRLRHYPLLRDERWRIDLGALERTLATEPRARAIVVVHPGNPTGAFTRRDDARALADLAAAHGAVLLVDEVFADFAHGPLAPDRLPSFAAAELGCRFVLSGLSKVALAPQLKLGWIVVAGPAPWRAEALARLELVADTYLSVSTAVERALPAILDRAEPLQRVARARIAQNLGTLDGLIAAEGPLCPLRRPGCDGGWYALVEVPRTRSDDEWLTLTVRTAGVLVHPGYLFDLAEAGTMVLSLLPEPERFAPAAAAVVKLWAEA